MPIMFWCTDDDRVEWLFYFNADHLASSVIYLILIAIYYYYSGLWSTFFNTVFMFFWHPVCLSVCGVL